MLVAEALLRLLIGIAALRLGLVALRVEVDALLFRTRLCLASGFRERLVGLARLAALLGVLVLLGVFFPRRFALGFARSGLRGDRLAALRDFVVLVVVDARDLRLAGFLRNGRGQSTAEPSGTSAIYFFRCATVICATNSLIALRVSS